MLCRFIADLPQEGSQKTFSFFSILCQKAAWQCRFKAQLLELRFLVLKSPCMHTLKTSHHWLRALNHKVPCLFKTKTLAAIIILLIENKKQAHSTKRPLLRRHSLQALLYSSSQYVPKIAPHKILTPSNVHHSPIPLKTFIQKFCCDPSQTGVLF